MSARPGFLAAPGSAPQPGPSAPRCARPPADRRFEGEIGIDDADQRQMWEMMALGDELRADDQMLHSPLAIVADRIARAALPRARSLDRMARRASGKALRRFFRQSLDARTAGTSCLGAAVRTWRRHRFDMTAMMAHELPAETVLDQRGRAIRAFDSDGRRPGTASAAHSRAG